MDLAFYESLSQPQKNYARYIAERAKEMGIPPELAVAIAFKESSLNPMVQAGAAGEIGIMQIKPDTAKEMGFSAEDIKDPRKNIDAGLAYLKKSLEMSDGAPRLAAAGYNAGVNHPFFKSPDAQLPETTARYLKDLKGFGAFTAIPTPEPVEPQLSEEELAEQKSIEQAFEQAAKDRGGLTGLAGGIGASALYLAPQAVKGAAKSVGRAIEEGKIAADTQAGIDPRQASQPSAGPRPAAGPTQLGAPGTFPRATGPGQATYNYARSYGLPEIEAGRALSTTKEPGGVWDLLGKRQEALTNIQQRFPTETYVENPRFGGIMTPDQGPGAGPRASYVQQPGGLQSIPTRSPVPVTPPSKGALEEVKALFQRMIGSPESTRGKASRLAMKALGPPALGYQAGSEFGALSHEMDKESPDYTKATLSGLSGLGALMSMHPATMPVGAPLAVGAPLFSSAIEKGRGRPLGQMGDVTAP